MGYLTNKQILVTGGAGFLGRHVCDALREFEPAQIIVPRSNRYDLRDAEATRAMLERYRPQVIIHLAALVGGIGANRSRAGEYFYENALMGIQLMEAARRHGVEKFVATGTICSYPKHTPVPFREEEFWNGYPEETNAAYGLAKKMLVVQAQAYRQQYGFNAISLLPVNLYGPGDNFDLETSHVIPALIRKAIEARSSGAGFVEAWGSGSVSREFLFVRDAARAISLASEGYDGPEAINIGSGDEITIRDLTALICRLCRFRGDIRWDSSRPDGQPRRCLDTSRAKREFGFSAKTPLRDGLVETIEWYERRRSSSGGFRQTWVGSSDGMSATTGNPPRTRIA